LTYTVNVFAFPLNLTAVAAALLAFDEENVFVLIADVLVYEVELEVLFL
jgi:hypothetical protein